MSGTEATHLHLMGAHKLLEVVGGKEGLGDVSTEAGALAPLCPHYVSVRICETTKDTIDCWAYIATL